MPSPQRKRLDSWKAIAEYLGRNVRTVTRWAEQRELPVHRVPGGKRQSVFAYSDEIDAWLLQQRSNTADQFASATDTQPIAISGGLNSKLFNSPASRILRVAWITLTIAVFVGSAVWITKGLIEGHNRAAAAVPLKFVQLTNDGRAKGYFHSDGRMLYFDESEGDGMSVFSVPTSGGQPHKVDVPLPNPAIQDVSRDGKYLLVSSFTGIEVQKSLWVVPSDGGLPHRVGDILCQSARWSPDDRQIACVNGTSILISDSDGKRGRTLVSLPSTPIRLIWTPDGKQLIFILQDPPEPSDGSAWEVSTEGDRQNTSHTPVALPWGKHCCIDWTWIDGGKEFLYLRSSRNGPPVLGAISMSNGYLNRPVERAELPVNIGKISDFTFDDQNNLLYLLNSGKSREELLRIGPTKSTYEVVLPGVAADEISYSRDGRWMTFVNPSDYTLWRSRSDGSDALQLTRSAWQAELSAWSPDDHTVAYMGKAPGKPWRIFLIDRNGGVEREAAPRGDDNQGAPSWSPDGKMLAYGNVLCQETQTCWIREIDVRTGKVTQLPGSRGLRTARFSPDGRYIAALQPEQHELVLFDTNTKAWRTLAGSVTGDNINWSADSRFVFIDNPRTEHPIIEKIRVADGHRVTVADLVPLQRMPGAVSPWFGLSPDGSPILLHYYTASEIYALNWKLQ